jgi:hypothetical protein
VDASIQASELVGFLDGLRVLGESLRGEAKFWTLEEQLSLKLVGDGKGGTELTGELLDQPGIGNRLLFGFRLDQTFLMRSIGDLARVVEGFPVRESKSKE